jgi:ligand-binding sensor domain-containing protein
MNTWLHSISFGILLAVAAKPAATLDSAKSMRQYGLDIWDSRDGLPHDTIRAIHRTRDGYLWLGTDAGLVRFDGMRFELFDSSNTEAFNNNDVRSLFEDDAGALWIGTQGSGVIRLKDDRFTRFSKKDGVGFSVWSIVQGPDGRVWFGAEWGLTVFDGERMSDQSGRIPAATGQSECLAFDKRTASPCRCGRIPPATCGWARRRAWPATHTALSSRIRP